MTLHSADLSFFLLLYSGRRDGYQSQQFFELSPDKMEAILHCVVASTWQQPCYRYPFGADGVDQMEYESIFCWCPFHVPDVRFQMIQVPFTALFAGAPTNCLRNLGPFGNIVAKVSIDSFQEQSIFLYNEKS